jgi:pteridine reductase
MTRPLAMITGCSRAGRVGHACAVALARRGCDLLLTYRAGSGGGAGAIAAECERLGAAVTLRELDLSDLAAVTRAGEELAGSLPRLDVLVHNASWYEPSELSTLTAKTLVHAMAVNAHAPALLSATLSPVLAASVLPGGGSIVSMCDIHARGELGQPRRAHLAYGMSKAALLEMTLALARELAPRVRCNAVAPGVVAFPDSGHEADSQMQARYLQRVPLGRSGTPQEAAAAVVYLALDATYTTGQVLTVDGGRSLT